MKMEVEVVKIEVCFLNKEDIEKHLKRNNNART